MRFLQGLLCYKKIYVGPQSILKLCRCFLQLARAMMKIPHVTPAEFVIQQVNGIKLLHDHPISHNN
jgi:hypothetical protein